MKYESSKKMIASNQFFSLDWATFLRPIYFKKQNFFINSPFLIN